MVDCCKKVNDRHFPPALFMIGGVLRRMFGRTPRSILGTFLKEGMSVVDAGSGPGYFTRYISDSIGKTGKLLSLDSDPRMVMTVEKLCRKKNLSNVAIKEGSAAAMDFIPDQSADFVLSSGVLCCMAEHDKAVSEITRIMKDTGVAMISVSKHLPESDPRTVSKAEWRSILARFNIVSESETAMELKAAVSKRVGNQENP